MIIRFRRDGSILEEINEGIAETFCQFGFGRFGMMYLPEDPAKRNGIAVVLMHCDANYMAWAMGPYLAKKGFTALALDSWQGGIIDRKMEYLGQAVRYLKGRDDIRKVVLMGHSGGATLMTAYQAVAENGVDVFRGDNMIYKCTVREPLEPADGVILLDANYGNAVMTLISLDPAIKEEGNAMDLDPAFDIFDPANGYDRNGANYSAEFIKKYRAAQAARNDRLIDAALERLARIEAGEGLYKDDEPLIIAGGSQIKPNNRLLPEDLHLLAHTRGEYDLLHGDGTVTHEQIRSLRTPEIDRSMTSSYDAGSNPTTVRSFLSSQAIRTNDDFALTEDNVTGVEWDSSYASPIGNIQHISAPTIMMGMTAGYEYMAAELIFEHAKMEDKEICFIRGAEHNFNPNRAAEKIYGSFGDTESVVYDKMADWMNKRFA